MIYLEVGIISVVISTLVSLFMGKMISLGNADRWPND